MISISLCMIVRDEEDVLQRCLSNAHDLVDEIIIVDTGSKDKTKKIARKFTDKIYDFDWIDDFSAARNFSFSKATKEYIFYLDADDIITEEDRKKFKVLKETLDPSVDSVTMKYHVAFDQDGNVSFSYRRNRLVKRSKNFKWEGACHNLLVVSGKIINSDIAITHKKMKKPSDRNLRIYQKQLKNGKEFNARDTYYYANELFDNGLYEEGLLFYNKLFDRSDGWFENKIHACGRVSDYYSSIDDLKNALRYAFKSFEYAPPRADLCCKIGDIFKKQNRLYQAIYWYELAVNLEKPENSWGFFQEAYWTWIPNLQLCVCYDRLGDHGKAYQYNEIARSYVPNNPSVKRNIAYFKSIGFADSADNNNKN